MPLPLDGYSIAYYYLNLTATETAPLAVVCGGWERCLPEYEMRRRTFRYHSIEFVAKGRGELSMHGRTTPLVSGVAFSYGPGIAHRIRTDPDHPMTKYFIDFTGATADKLLRATALSDGPVQVAEPTRVRTMLDEIHRHAEEAGPHATTIAVLLLKATLLTIDALAGRASGTQLRAAQSYARCKQHIDENFKDLDGLTDVAEGCRMDPATICRLFKRFGDCSPYQYLLRRKMNHAAERLQASDVMVKEVAADMGFSDPYHFSRAFKRVHGLAPQRFQRLTMRSTHGESDH